LQEPCHFVLPKDSRKNVLKNGQMDTKCQLFRHSLFVSEGINRAGRSRLDGLDAHCEQSNYQSNGTREYKSKTLEPSGDIPILANFSARSSDRE
jgi:hypothetical protein